MRERQRGKLTCQGGRQNVKPEGVPALLSRAFMFPGNDFIREGQGTQKQHRKKMKLTSLLSGMLEELPHLQLYPKDILRFVNKRG